MNSLLVKNPLCLNLQSVVRLIWLWHWAFPSDISFKTSKETIFYVADIINYLTKTALFWRLMRDPKALHFNFQLKAARSSYLLLYTSMGFYFLCPRKSSERKRKGKMSYWKLTWSSSKNPRIQQRGRKCKWNYFF